jgi:hypothetical protein
MEARTLEWVVNNATVQPIDLLIKRAILLKKFLRICLANF